MSPMSQLFGIILLQSRVPVFIITWVVARLTFFLKPAGFEISIGARQV